MLTLFTTHLSTCLQLSTKTQEAYEALEKLMDPTRNMAAYRNLYSEACKVDGGVGVRLVICIV